MTGLTDALRAEYAAVFGYGVVGAHLAGRLLVATRKAEEAHRRRRDATLQRLSTADPASAPAAEPAYALPFPVTERNSALKLAIHLEERTTAVWRAVLSGVRGPDRAMALDALVDSAVFAARWRRVAGLAATVPLPGAPPG